MLIIFIRNSIYKLIIGALLLTPLNLKAQYVLDNATQWYNRTEDGTSHFIYEMGKDNPKDKTVVVLHGGWGAEHSYLIEPFEKLSEDFRFILYDQRGSLRTPAADSTLTLPRMVKDLEALRQELKLEKMTLAAHSMGNHLAYAYLEQYPDRVHSLILMSPVLPTPFGGEAENEFLDEVWPEANFEALGKSSREFKIESMKRGKQTALKEGLLPDSLKTVPAKDIDFYNIGNGKQRTQVWRIFFTSVNSCSPENWREMRGGQVFYEQGVANQLVNDQDYTDAAKRFWPALKSFKGQVHVVIGTCDFVDIGPSIWPNVVDDLNNGNIHIIENGGHNSWMNGNDDFHKSMDNILSSLFK